MYTLNTLVYSRSEIAMLFAIPAFTNLRLVQAPWPDITYAPLFTRLAIVVHTFCEHSARAQVMEAGIRTRICCCTPKNPYILLQTLLLNPCTPTLLKHKYTGYCTPNHPR
ncbi:hypothetical protein FRC07_012923, partial [Ceratobasidium sp. 392]